jgi:hypothetical protein
MGVILIREYVGERLKVSVSLNNLEKYLPEESGARSLEVLSDPELERLWLSSKDEESPEYHLNPEMLKSPVLVPTLFV